MLLLLGACALCHALPLPQFEQASPRRVAPSRLQPANATLGATIPGLRQGAIPQGLATLPGHRSLLLSHYFVAKHPSCISLIDVPTGTLSRALPLNEPDGTPHRGHAGGVAANSNTLWLASGPRLLSFALAPFDLVFPDLVA